jgi:hypothetical protein
LDIAPNLLPKAVLHHTLVSCSCDFQAKRHYLITKHFVRCDERRFSSSSNFNLIWLYPEYASRKESLAQPVVESIIWSIRGSAKGSFGQCLLRAV